MKDGEGNHLSTVQFEKNGSECTITINDLALTEFVIVYDPASSIDDNEMFVTSLNSVSPNPVTTSANIEFTLTRSESVSFELIDVLGNVVEVINSGNYQAGTHTIDWKVANSGIVSGTYTIRMKAGNVSSSMPVVLVK
jgi:flagellar hook assembly protein FlgD